MEQIAKQAVERGLKARDEYGPYSSLHEAYAVLLEEVDELWELVKTKRDPKSPSPMLDHCIADEALDIAAVALRIANLELDTER